MSTITMKPEDQIEQAGPVDEVVSKMYADLKRLARGQMRGERPGHTLQTSALVHEAYLRLVRSGHADHMAGGELLAIASHLMRQVLVDHARKVRAAKRGGPCIRVELADFGVAQTATPEVLALHDALDELAKRDPRKAKIIEMRYFGGLSVEEVATAMGLSTKTIIRDWTFGKTWLRRELGPNQDHAGQ